MKEQTAQRLRHHFPSFPFVLGLIVALMLAVAAFIFFGVYNIAADAPHTRIVYVLLDSLRDRSIAIRAQDVSPPADLDTPARVAVGAGLYGEMCSGCHLGPGIEKSEMSQGLYPQAPDLAKVRHTPAETFWIIKHGVKLSAMPAWGKTHPDPLIWDMVAFVRKLPGLSAPDYQRLVASAPEDHDEMMKNMPGMEHMHDGK